jgi:tetratricopeptide (TPR) repeat protein
MRSANLFAKFSLMLVLAHAMTGCALIEKLEKAVKEEQAAAEKSDNKKTAAAKPATPPADKTAAAASEKTATAQKPSVPVAPPEPPINPATQRMFDEANRALKAGRIDDAEHGYRAIIQSNPELGGPHANLGVIYRNANKLSEAVAEFIQAVRLSPKQPAYLNQLGITYRHMGQFDKARDAYEQAISADANYAPAILNLGILSDMYLGDSQRALDLFNRYLTLVPNGDTAVTKWVAELKNRKPVSVAAAPKEKS